MAGLVLSPLTGEAAVSGQCSGCHTMHNSQAGNALAYTVDATGAHSPDSIPNPALLVSDCVGCHTGTNTGSGSATNTTPYVFTPSASVSYGATGVSGNTLAGGNFAWVAGDHRTGHNVVSVPGVVQDSPLGVSPPGWPATPVRQAIDVNIGLTCAGTNGCHGDYTVTSEMPAISGSHHNGVNGATDGSDLFNSYRLLNGIAGYEDPDWEYQPTSTAHNQYKGEVRSQGSDVTGNNTISGLCGQCHGDFHSGAGTASGSFWIRHPTDFDMTGLGGEFASYNTDGSTYSVVAPLASSTVTSVISSGVLTGGGKAIVMCLSCHRAHGTPYGSMLRWDYKGWPENGLASNGCDICHTTKN